MKKTSLKSKDVNKLLEKYNITINKKYSVVLLEDKYKLILVDGIPSFFYYDKELLPTLKYLQKHSVLKKIIVDMGAVKFVINGADIMRPGIVEISEGINKNEFIVIVDQNNQKPLSIGIALFDSKEMEEIKSGKVIKNIHFVGDEIWKMV